MVKKGLIISYIPTTILFSEDITVTGTVVSDGQKMIGSKYMGYVKKVFVKLGDRVKREDDLYEIRASRV